jgi:hypothetical protein
LEIINICNDLFVLRNQGKLKNDKNVISINGKLFVLVGKPEGKRPLGRPRRRWEDNIKADL